MSRPHRVVFAAYVVTAGLALLWYKRVIIAIGASDRTVFIAMCFAGIVAAGIALDSRERRFIRTERTERGVHAGQRRLAAACLGLAVPATTAVAGSGAVRLMGLALAGALVGAGFFAIQFACLRLLPWNRRATAFASAFMAAGAVNTTTDIPELSALRVVGTLPNLAMGCACLAVAAGVIMRFGTALDTRRVAISEAERASARQVALIGALSLVSFLLLSVPIALQESMVYPAAIAGIANNQVVRYVELPIFLVAGLAADRLGRQTVIVTALASAAIGAMGQLVPGSAVTASVSTLCAYSAVIAFPVAYVALVVDALSYAKHPALLGSLTFAPVFAGQLVESLLRSTVAAMPTGAQFLVNAVCLVLFAALTAGLLELVRRNLTSLQVYTTVVELNDAAPPLDLAAIAADHGLTRREQEILALSLDGLTTREMATRLFLTEATVKFHTRNLLKKTGAATRADMVEHLAASAAASASGPGPGSSPARPMPRWLTTLGRR
ncbi:MAG: helix-turn-helix transcriptional regulator [Bifidobacteriaceae bacterium]|jgi:DNA-binding CsgD family transcriptional regulator|nr:helix-turn-helix transcriptional regulator [Bifidobacteriaceae bacterium]